VLVETEEQRVRGLARVAHALGRSQALDQMLETACEEARVALESATVSVSRIEVGTYTVRTLVNVGSLASGTEKWPEDETYDIDEFGNLRQLMDWRLSWAVAVDDPDADSREVRLLRELGKGSAVGAPMVVDGQLWGMLYASRPPGGAAYGPDEMAYLEAMAAILSGSVSRAMREESLNQLAYRDPLTGLPNRRALDERADRGFEVPSGVARDVTVVVVDINGLKAVNDSHGHLVGDQLIKAVGGSLQRSFAELPGVLVARVGGDEFVAVSAGHDPARVLEIADDMCGQVWDFGVAADVSCGAATARITDATTLTPRDLFAAADRAQYAAKNARLRRTMLADEVPAETVPVA
jgi:diguanylate cyclase (GGDEF)-like protein